MSKIIVCVLLITFGACIPYAYRGIVYQPQYDVETCLDSGGSSNM